MCVQILCHVVIGQAHAAKVYDMDAGHSRPNPMFEVFSTIGLVRWLIPGRRTSRPLTSFVYHQDIFGFIGREFGRSDYMSKKRETLDSVVAQPLCHYVT